MRAWRILFLPMCVLLAGCASTPPYQLHTAASRSIFFSSFGALQGGTSYYADGYAVVEEDREYSPNTGKYPIRKQKKARLTVEQWNDFWGSVDRLAIERWRTNYTTEGTGVTVSDGEEWRVEMRKGGLLFGCQGRNAYPSLGHPKRRTLNRAVITQLIAIFEQRFSARQNGD